MAVAAFDQAGCDGHPSRQCRRVVELIAVVLQVAQRAPCGGLRIEELGEFVALSQCGDQLLNLAGLEVIAVAAHTFTFGWPDRRKVTADVIMIQ